MSIKTVSRVNTEIFEKEVNELLVAGWRILNVNVVNSTQYGPTHTQNLTIVWCAVLVKDIVT